MPQKIDAYKEIEEMLADRYPDLRWCPKFARHFVGRGANAEAWVRWEVHAGNPRTQRFGALATINRGPLTIAQAGFGRNAKAAIAQAMRRATKQLPIG
jgi:hypothetical protein